VQVRLRVGARRRVRTLIGAPACAQGGGLVIAACVGGCTGYDVVRRDTKGTPADEILRAFLRDVRGDLVSVVGIVKPVRAPFESALATSSLLVVVKRVT